MSSYLTIRNPLLPSPPVSSSRNRFRKSDLLSNLSLSTTATLKSSISTASIRSFMNQTINQISHAGTNLRIGTNKRIMPLSKSQTEKNISKNDNKSFYVQPFSSTKVLSSVKKNSVSDIAEPLVHYNGPCHTLESLPVEKLAWIKDEQASALVKNPLSSYNKSIVLRKPLMRSQTYPTLVQQSVSKSAKPKAMFYLRVLQVIATNSSKQRLFRCGIQVNQETCLSSYTSSEKSGRNSSIAQFDETFLFDIDSPLVATINVYAQTKPNKLFRSEKQEVCIGRETINVSLQPKSKTTERFILNSDPKSGISNDFQLLVVHGTYVSRRTQNMLNNTVLFEDYITAYVRTDMTPRWDRFWGVLRGVQFELYDFEYKENRPPLYIVPLGNFVNAFDPSEEDGEELRIDIGARGIALQFTNKALKKRERHWMSDDLEFRMYLLPESSAAAREWESKFNYVASIFDEVRGWGLNNSSTFQSSSYYATSSEGSFSGSFDSEEEEENGSDVDLGEDKEKLTVPLKLMW